MLTLILSAALSQWAPNVPPGMLQYDPGAECGRTGGRCFLNRTSNRPRDNLAFFEFAPASGSGMGTACACAAVTGAKGEAVTFTRTGVATCSPLGSVTTGIANASLVECAADTPRVESLAGVLSLRTDDATTNILTRFIDYANAAWADVGTPTLTGSQVSPWTGTYANLAVQFDDNDGAGFEGRSQPVTVGAGSSQIMSCYVKAGTLDSARLSLDGTTADFTGLSSTTWSIITVNDASASGVSISAQVLNGSTAAATGTVIWGGCQVETRAIGTSPYTPMVPTVAASATRNAETAYATIVFAKTTTEYSMAANLSVAKTTSQNWQGLAVATGATQPGSYLYNAAAASLRCESVNGAATSATRAAAGAFSGRVACFNDLSNEQGVYLGVAFATPSAGGRTAPATTRMYLGCDPSAGFALTGHISGVCLDLSGSRCR